MSTRTVTLQIVGDDKSATDMMKNIQGHADTTGGKFAGMAGTVKGAFSSMTGALGGLLPTTGPAAEAFNKVKEGVAGVIEKWEHLESPGKKAGAVLLGVGAAATGLGAVLLEAGHKQEVATSQLEVAIKNVGGEYEEYKSKINSVVKANENHAISEVQTKDALSKLTLAFNDPQKAIEAMGHVLDLSKSKHEDLTAAADQYIKVVGGKGAKILMGYGINTKNMVDVQKEAVTSATELQKATDAHAAAVKKLTDLEEVDHAKKKLSVGDEHALRDARALVVETTNTLAASTTLNNRKQEEAATGVTKSKDALDQFNKKLDGTAKAMDNNLGTAFNSLKVKITDGVGKLGNEFGGTLIKTGPLLMGLGAIMETGLVPKVVLLGGEIVGTGVMWVTTHLSMLAASISTMIGINISTGGLLLILGAIIAAVLLVWKNWDAIWGWIKEAFQVAVGWIKSHAELLLAIFLPFLLPFFEILKHWKEIWGTIQDVFGTVWGAIKSVGSGIGGFFKGIWDGIVGSLKWGINAAIGLINSAISFINSIKVSIPSFIPVIGGSTFGLNIKPIPTLATGGTALLGGWAEVGERGRELVHLPAGASVVPLNGSVPGMGGGGTHVVFEAGAIVVHEASDPAATAKAVMVEINRYQGRNGRSAWSVSP